MYKFKKRVCLYCLYINFIYFQKNKTIDDCKKIIILIVQNNNF